MNNRDIEERILKCFSECGIPVSQEYDGEDIPHSLFIPDSLVFINLVLEIEREFDIDYPDELLTMESFGSLKGLANTISEILGKSIV